MAVEEMAELIQALMKHPRKQNGSTLNEVIEEIADVEIMLEQLKFIFVVKNNRGIEYAEIKEEKLRRLEEMQEEVRK